MPRKKTDERRSEIVVALLNVMADQGYAKATVNKIATEAGLTAGLIHYHFKNKQEILLELLDRIISDQLRLVDEEWENDISEWKRITTFIEHYLHSGPNADPARVAAWVTITAESIRQPEVASAFRDALFEMTSRLSRVIRSGIANGEFTLASDLSPDAASAAITSLIQGYFNLGVTARDLIPRGSAAEAAVQMASGLLRPA